MGKLDALNRVAGANADESMGQGTVVNPGPPRPDSAPTMPARLVGITKARNAAEIPLERIVRDPDQPRRTFDEASLDRLAESLRAQGQLQPAMVRWDEGQGVYVLICGERRWQAARRAGLATLACVIRDKPTSADELLTLQLIENVGREDLKPTERARAYHALMTHQGWSQNRLAKELGIAQSSVSDALALLDLPESAQQQVDRGDVAPSTARKVLRVADPRQQRELIERAAAGETRDAIAAEAGARSTVDKSRGRGARRPKKLTSKVVRTTAGKVTVELRKGDGEAAILAAIDEAAAIVRAKVESKADAA